MMILDSLLHPALIHRNYSYCMNSFGDYYGNERVEKTVGRQKKIPNKALRTDRINIKHCYLQR